MVRDNLGMGIWRSECVRVGLHGTLKFKLEISSGQSMAELRMLCISFKSVLRIRFGILGMESVGKTVSAGILRKWGTLYLTILLKKFVTLFRAKILDGAEMVQMGEQYMIIGTTIVEKYVRNASGSAISEKR